MPRPRRSERGGAAAPAFGISRLAPQLLFGALLAASGCQTTVKESASSYSISDAKPGSIVDAELKKLLEDVAEYPKRHDLHYRIAGIHFAKGEYRESADRLRRALSLAPSEPKYHFRLGQTYLRMQELGLAEKEFREAVRLWPPGRYSGPHAFLGYVLSLKRDHAGAIDEFKRCIETDPENPDFYYAVGAQYDIMGRKDEAARYFHDYLLRGGTTYRKNAVFLLRKLGADVPESALDGPPPGEGPERS